MLQYTALHDKHALSQYENITRRRMLTNTVQKIQTNKTLIYVTFSCAIPLLSPSCTSSCIAVGHTEFNARYTYKLMKYWCGFYIQTRTCKSYFINKISVSYPFEKNFHQKLHTVSYESSMPRRKPLNRDFMRVLFNNNCLPQKARVRKIGSSLTVFVNCTTNLISIPLLLLQ